ncbi:MAG: protein translocase subunit SecD, partial [Polyangiaceae bacterium]|nr:protein translocase subunit SecD [Polyangiaceae bacterium]
SIQFKREGAADFESMTGTNVQRRMAIVLDERVESAPVIQARIGGGRAQITLGSYLDYQSGLNEARDLVVVLKAGALPAPLRPSNEQLIGPTLGGDSIRLAVRGALIGVLLVLVFIAVYYEVAGLVSDAMVLINLLLQLAIMAAFEATLTLPGLAATALTVGMAVDANVLITERIREELRLGKSARTSVDLGFDRAFWSILDGQITTLIAGIVLFQYGTGPIKGFAVMLMIGIVTSLFTGLFCSRVAMDFLVRGLRVQRLRVG